MNMKPAKAIASLADLAVGQRGIIRSLQCAIPLMQRLLEMGFTRGASVQVVRFAPLGDPMEVRVRGYYLSLRRGEAGLIRIDPETRP